MTDVPANSLTRPQVMALVDCMLSTARIDDMHPPELALIRKFYEEQRKPDMPPFDAVVAAAATGKDPAQLSSLGSDAGFAEQLVLMCLMTGYADGQLSEAEHQHVIGLAQQLGIAAPRVGELLVHVKDSLIASLAHLPDSASVAALAKTL